MGRKLFFVNLKCPISHIRRYEQIFWNRGATSCSFRGGNFHEFSFDDVIVLIQPCYNVFANGHRQSSLRSIPENENFSVLSRCRPNDQDRVKISGLTQTRGSVLKSVSDLDGGGSGSQTWWEAPQNLLCSIECSWFLRRSRACFQSKMSYVIRNTHI